MKWFCLLLIFLFPAVAAANENFPYFTSAQSIAGPTGNITTPSAKTVPYSTWSFGLHRFIVGVNYGLLRDVEVGMNFDLKGMSPLFPLDGENIDRKRREVSFDSKLRLLKEEVHPLDVSIGQRRGMAYLVAGKYSAALWNMNVQAGLAWEGGDTAGLFSLSRTGDDQQVLFDYEPFADRYNLGWRFLVSPEMKLDFFLIDVTRMKNMVFDNFLFGLTLTE